MTQRLFDEFESQNTAFKFRKFKKGDLSNDKFCITIPLKNSQNMRGQVKLDEEFIKVIEHEYAVKFLEYNKTQATSQAITRLLKA